MKVVKVWNRIVTLRDAIPPTRTRRSRSWPARAGVPPEEYADVHARHALPDARGGAEALRRKADSLDSLLRQRQGRRRLQRREQGLRGSRSPSTTYIDGSLSKEALAQVAVGEVAPTTTEAPTMRGSLVRGRSRGSAAGASAGLLGGCRSSCRSLLWCAVSYLPFIWHPMVRVTDPGDVDLDRRRACWSTVRRSTGENAELRARHGRLGRRRARQPGLPAGAARRWRARWSPGSPRRPRGPTSRGCTRACGTASRSSSGASCCRRSSACRWASCAARCRRSARLTEPFIEFFRYLPAPAFGALAVAVLGIDDAPKVAIIFIGTFFQQVLVIANTTRQHRSGAARGGARRWARRGAAADHARGRSRRHHRHLHATCACCSAGRGRTSSSPS